MKSRTLATIVLGLALTLGACEKPNEPPQKQYKRQDKTERITGEITNIDENSSIFLLADKTKRMPLNEVTGEIIDIDEDSIASFFGYGQGSSGGSNFEFENFRIKDDDGNIYNLIYPGPSSYRKGDRVEKLKVERLRGGSISYEDLAGSFFLRHLHLPGLEVYCQKGSINAHGIIKNQ